LSALFAAGERYMKYIQQGKIADLASFTSKKKLTELFTAVIFQAFLAKQNLCPPTSYYQIGFLL